MKHPFSYAVALVLSLSAAPAHAAGLTLADALSRAVARHPEIRAAEAEVDAARARERQVRAFANPSLSLQADEMPLSNLSGGNLMAGVTWLMPQGRARDARAEIGRLETTMAKTEVSDRRRELVAQVKTAYALVLHHAEQTRLARGALGDAERLHRAAEARYASGDVPRVEVFRTEVERNRAQRDVQVAEARRALAERRLGLLVGLGPDEAVEVSALPVPPARGLAPIGELRSLMRTERPEFRRAELAVAAEQRQRSLALASVWEGSELSLAAGLAEGQPAMSTALSLPLPVFRNRAELEAADARIRQAEARLEATRQRLDLELEEAHQEAAIAATRWQLVAESELPQARRFAENARRRYLAGEGSGLEAVEAMRTLSGVETDHLEALLDYREALVRLEKTVGTDLPR